MANFTINSLSETTPQDNEFILKSNANGVLTKTPLSSLKSLPSMQTQVGDVFGGTGTNLATSVKAVNFSYVKFGKLVMIDFFVQTNVSKIAFDDSLFSIPDELKPAAPIELTVSSPSSQRSFSAMLHTAGYVRARCPFSENDVRDFLPSFNASATYFVK